MDDQSTDVVPGTLDMLILKTLSLAPMHGFGIGRRVEQVSRGVFKVNAGSLLVALQRLERNGLLDAEWRQTENGRRGKYYSLTRAGRKQLDVETEDCRHSISQELDRDPTFLPHCVANDLAVAIEQIQKVLRERAIRRRGPSKADEHQGDFSLDGLAR